MTKLFKKFIWDFLIVGIPLAIVGGYLYDNYVKNDVNVSIAQSDNSNKKGDNDQANKKDESEEHNMGSKEDVNNTPKGKLTDEQKIESAIISEPQKSLNIPEQKRENFESFINATPDNSPEQIEVFVAIIDEKNNISSSVSSSIANIYNQGGKKGKTGLLKGSFINTKEFAELLEGSSDIIEKLKLDRHTDYLAIGRIKYSMRSGTIVSGTIICSASVSMTIISVLDKTISQSFEISNANGNGATESQAKERALQILLDNYTNQYSSL